MATNKTLTAGELREFMPQGKSACMDTAALLYDADTFVETSAFMKSSCHVNGDGNYENIVTGYGAVDDRLVFSFIENGELDCGGFGAGSAKKLCRLLGLALRDGAPIVGVFNSKGAYVGDGMEVIAAYRDVMNAVRAAKKELPMIAVVNGMCGGAMAVIARMFDVVVKVGEKSEIFVNPPFNAGAADALADGTADVSFASLDEAFAYVRELLALLPSRAGNTFRADCADFDPDADLTGMAAEDIVPALADGGRFLETAAGYAKGCVSTGFASFNGIGTGVVVIKNSICSDGCLKAAKTARICARLGLPLVTFVDCEGYSMKNAEGIAEFAAQLSDAYDCGGIRLNVICGAAYGSVSALIANADYTIALDGAKIAPLSPAASAQLLSFDRIKAASDPAAERAAVEGEYAAAASPVEAARSGFVDDICAPTELKAKFAAALEMLYFRD